MIEEVGTRPLTEAERQQLRSRTAVPLGRMVAGLAVLAVVFGVFGFLLGAVIGWVLSLAGWGSVWFSRGGALLGIAVVLVAGVSFWFDRIRLLHRIRADLDEGQAREVRVSANRVFEITGLADLTLRFALELEPGKLLLMQGRTLEPHAGRAAERLSRDPHHHFPFPCLEFVATVAPRSATLLSLRCGSAPVEPQKTVIERGSARLPEVPEFAQLEGTLEQLESEPGAIIRQLKAAARL